MLKKIMSKWGFTVTPIFVKYDRILDELIKIKLELLAYASIIEEAEKERENTKRELALKSSNLEQNEKNNITSFSE